MRQKYFFDNDKITYPEFLKTIGNMLENRIFFCEKECISTGIDALDKLDENNKNRLMDIAFSVDRVFYVPGAHNRNCARKLPIILKCADLLANTNGKTDELSKEELVLLSYFYSTYQIPYDSKKFTFFLDKEVLKSVQNKTNDYGVQFDMLTAIDMKLDDIGINDTNDEQYGFIKKEMINTINTSSTDQILNMVDVQARLIKTLKETNL